MRTTAALFLCCLGSMALAAPPSLPPIPTRAERDLVRRGEHRVRPAAAPTAEAPAATTTAQDAFDVTRYTLDLAFDPAARTVSGTVTIEAASTVAGLAHVTLDLYDNMAVASVTRAGQPLATSHAGNVLDIALDRPFDAGEAFTLAVTYSGSPQQVDSSFGWNKYRQSGLGDAVWSLSEPIGARTWWPSKDRPEDKALVEERWTVPSAWIATGNGVLVATENAGGGRTRYTWRATHPLTTYLVSIAATNYATFSDTYATLDGGTMPVAYYVYPELLDAARTSFSNTPAMIGAFARTFGEYPFVEDKYGMSLFPWSGGMEHSTNTSIGYQLVDGTHRYDFLFAHELAHQWWGDSLSPRTWKDTWLNEGFATWSEAAWAESVGGATAYHDYMQSFWSPTFPGPVYDPDDLFGDTVYSKGGWVVHMLRGVLGDDAFFSALRDWYRDHKDGVVDTEMLRRTMEARYGRDLGWFFDEWVYGTGQPAYQYGARTAQLGPASFRTYVQVKQVQDGNAFTMPLRIELQSAGTTDVRAAWNDRADQTFTFDTTSAPTGVVVDRDQWVLAASRAVITLPDADGDGVPDAADVCPHVADPAQADADHDGIGDACETGALAADIDNSHRVDGIDLAMLGRAFGRRTGDPGFDARADIDRNGLVDGEDLRALGSAFGQTPAAP